MNSPTEPEPVVSEEELPSGDAGAVAAAPEAGVDLPGALPERCDIGTFTGTRPDPLRLSGNTFAHDPTLLAVEGGFMRFWTGDNVPTAFSEDLLRWENAAPVYAGGYPQWVTDWKADHPGNTFNFPWAPDVSFFEGRYHLYSSFSAFFGRNQSCITHLSTDDPKSGNWTDHGPVICTDGSQNYNAIDADVSLDTEGNIWLAFGSFWDGIFMMELDTTGARKNDNLEHLAAAREIEAPVLFYRCGYYYLFVTFGLCCPGEGRSVQDLTYRVGVGRSEHIQGPYVDREGRALLEGGGTLLVEGDGTYAAAGHSDVFVSGDRIYHTYHAYRRADAGAELRIVELPFDEEGWPVGGTP
jgi:arabinan endo-1,5-alpha-L-arabinosidase